MTIKELIQELHEQLDRYGNIDVRICDEEIRKIDCEPAMRMINGDVCPKYINLRNY